MHINYKLKYLGIIVILISGYFFLYNFSSSLSGHTICIFKRIVSLPCPACGSTRATLLLLHGEIWSSILLNPLGVITNSIILLSIFWMIKDIIKDRETYLPFLKRDWDRRVKIIVFILIVANWIWNIVKGL